MIYFDQDNAGTTTREWNASFKGTDAHVCSASIGLAPVTLAGRVCQTIYVCVS